MLLATMWFGLFIFATLFVALSFSFQSGEIVKKMNSKDNFINPNDWSHYGSYKAKERIEGPLYDHEVVEVERQSCQTEMAKSTLERRVDYVTVRRFINLLLRKAQFEDLAGNTVPLESISSSKDEKLLMSFIASASAKEIQILLEFGQKKTGPYLRQIDEIFTNLISTEDSDLLPSRCRQSWMSWSEGIGNAWYSMTRKIDFMVVVYIATVAYIMWSIKLTLSREGSWKNLIFCFLIPSFVWEFSRLLEEEKVKQYSEELRLGNIPDHCLGIDNREWWDMIFGRKSEVQCYEYHLLKMGRPVLRVSIFKVAVNHLQEFLSIVITLTRQLTASSPDDWWITNIIMRTVAWMCLTFAVVASVAFYFLTKHPVVKKVVSSAVGCGSRVEPVEPAPVETIKPPPRRRNGNRAKRRAVEQVDGKTRDPLTNQNVNIGAGCDRCAQLGLQGKEGDIVSERTVATSLPVAPMGGGDAKGVGTSGEKVGEDESEGECAGSEVGDECEDECSSPQVLHKH